MPASARAPEDLYGLALDEFTPARDALAKELKAAGHKDEAAEVKALRKPSLAAWALNRTARDHPDAIAALRSAGAGVREAQEAALSGDAGGLREASRTLSDEIGRVAGLAAAALEAAGRPASPAQQEKFASTLRTAAVDGAAGEALARGVLVDDLGATGFSLLGSLSGDLAADTPASTRSDGLSGRRPDGAPARTGAEGGAGGPEPADDGEIAALPGAHHPARKPKAGKEQLEALEAARRELRRCDAEAEQAATRAQRRAERAELAQKRAAEAQREADEARSAAEEAAGEAEAARRRAAAAADALAAAESALPT